MPWRYSGSVQGCSAGQAVPAARARTAATARGAALGRYLRLGTLWSSGRVQIRSILVTLPSTYSHTSCSPSM